MYIYRNCEELSIYLFNKVGETDDYRYLIKGYKIGDVVNLKEDLGKVWEQIYTEYADLTDDNSTFRYMRLKARLIYLETRLFMCSGLILQMTSRAMPPKTTEAYIQAIRDWGIPYNKNKRDYAELEKAQRELNFSKNELELKNNELKEMQGDGKPQPLEKQIVMLEQALGRNLIDPKKTSVKKWVYLMDLVKQKNSQQSRKNG